MSIISLQAKAATNIDAGIFTWEISNDKVYADRAVAHLFDLNERMAENGLSITCYLERIDPQDRPRVARSIHAAILSGEPYQEDYRIIRRDGSAGSVMALGRCFRNGDGEPSNYAGMIFPKPEGHTEASALFWHCLSAYELAQRAGQIVAAVHLRNAMTALECRITTPLVCMH